MKNTLSTMVVTFVITLFLVYAWSKPLGRSESHAILSECGTLITTEQGMTYYMSESPLTLELEALAVLSECYEGVIVITAP